MSAFSGHASIRTLPDGSAAAAWGVHELRSAFQPIFAFADGQLAVVGFEALLRPMRHGEPSPLGPFFASIDAADRLHVETLSRALHLVNAARFLDPEAAIFVNFDPSIFIDRARIEHVVNDLRLIIDEVKLAPQRIVCEFTEHAAPAEASLSAFVEALRGHGHRIAVDDFGAADSDVRRIEKLRPDIVKFDARWVSTLMNSGPGFALLSDIVGSLQARGCLTVFEGIEKPWQLDLAEKAAVNMVQGYVLARPQVSPADFSAFPHLSFSTLSPARPSAQASPGNPVEERGRSAFGKRRRPPDPA